MNGRVIARVGMLAVGLGIGAAAASMPGTAAADSSTDWLSSIDSFLTGAAVPAADASGLNIAISYDGVTLLQEGTATASSGSAGDFAFADGADSSATATGTDSYADVYGDGSSATAGGTGSSTDEAFVYGDNSSAFAGGTDSSENLASVYGNDSAASAGGYGDNPGTLNIATIIGDGDGANAGSNAGGAGSDDIAYVEANDLGTANATGASDLIEILKAYDNWGNISPVTAASESVIPAADASNLWTDLLSALDPGSAAADSTNFLSELASLF